MSAITQPTPTVDEVKRAAAHVERDRKSKVAEMFEREFIPSISKPGEMILDQPNVDILVAHLKTMFGDTDEAFTLPRITTAYHDAKRQGLLRLWGVPPAPQPATAEEINTAKYEAQQLVNNQSKVFEPSEENWQKVVEHVRQQGITAYRTGNPDVWVSAILACTKAGLLTLPKTKEEIDRENELKDRRAGSTRHQLECVRNSKHNPTPQFGDASTIDIVNRAVENIGKQGSRITASTSEAPLPINASAEQMKNASPSQLKDLLARQQAAGKLTHTRPTDYKKKD
jgi:hypothetical protein